LFREIDLLLKKLSEVATSHIFQEEEVYRTFRKGESSFDQMLPTDLLEYLMLSDKIM
jgi:hypothetical protein